MSSVATGERPLDSPGQSGFICPDCGVAFAQEQQGRPVDRCCQECGAILWCSKRVEGDRVFLDAIARPAVEISDIARTGRALGRTGQVDAVVVNLRGLETVNSSFLAGLLALRRTVKEVGGRLILCELRPHVAEILRRLNLHVLFVIERREEDAFKAK